jgi:hypothetical protein
MGSFHSRHLSFSQFLAKITVKDAAVYVRMFCSPKSEPIIFTGKFGIPFIACEQFQRFFAKKKFRECLPFVKFVKVLPRETHPAHGTYHIDTNDLRMRTSRMDTRVVVRVSISPMEP